MHMLSWIFARDRTSSHLACENSGVSDPHATVAVFCLSSYCNGLSYNVADNTRFIPISCKGTMTSYMYDNTNIFEHLNVNT